MKTQEENMFVIDTGSWYYSGQGNMLMLVGDIFALHYYLLKDAPEDTFEEDLKLIRSAKMTYKELVRNYEFFFPRTMQLPAYEAIFALEQLGGPPELVNKYKNHNKIYEIAMVDFLRWANLDWVSVVYAHERPEHILLAYVIPWECIEEDFERIGQMTAAEAREISFPYVFENRPSVALSTEVLESATKLRGFYSFCSLIEARDKEFHGTLLEMLFARPEQPDTNPKRTLTVTFKLDEGEYSTKININLLAHGAIFEGYWVFYEIT